MNVLNNNAKNILRKNIKRFGIDIEFKKPVLNAYREVTDEFEITVTQRCIYHTTSECEPKQSDSGKSHSYKKEMLLTEYNESIKPETYCHIRDKFYRVYGTISYQQSDEFIDVLLEEVRHESNPRSGTNEASG